MVPTTDIDNLKIVKWRRQPKKILSKRKLIRVLSVFFFLFPRSAIAYALYPLPVILGLNYKSKPFGKLFLFVVACFIAFLLSSDGEKTSPTGFILSLALQFPFWAFLFGFELKEKLDGLLILRYINIFTLILSILNMMRIGFPLRLPYKDFLPDFYAAFYGPGGAKIVTMIGFFGVVAELFGGKRNSKLLIVAFLNFLVPNYLSGIIVGVAALGLVAMRKNIYLIPLVGLIILIVSPYAIHRFTFINDSFSGKIGYDPKVFAYVSLAFLFLKFPGTLLTGTGLGQFTSTPALWASPYISSLSTHDVPSLPGLNMSIYHQEILGPFLSIVSDNSIRSSANKPYSSVSTIIAEYGIILAIVVAVLFFMAFKRMNFSKKFTLSIFLFTCFAFAIDLWHDSFWYGYLLILSVDISKKAV